MDGASCSMAFHFQCRMPPKRLPLGWKDWGNFCLPQVFALPPENSGLAGAGGAESWPPAGRGARTTMERLLRVPGFKVAMETMTI